MLLLLLGNSTRIGPCCFPCGIITAPLLFPVDSDWEVVNVPVPGAAPVTAPPVHAPGTAPVPAPSTAPAPCPFAAIAFESSLFVLICKNIGATIAIAPAAVPIIGRTEVAENPFSFFGASLSIAVSLSAPFLLPESLSNAAAVLSVLSVIFFP